MISKNRSAALAKDIEDELYSWYAEEINKMNKSMNSGAPGDSGTETVEQETIRIEDLACNRFSLTSIYQLKDVIARKHS